MNVGQRVCNDTGWDGPDTALLLEQNFTNQFPNGRYLGIDIHHLFPINFDTGGPLFLGCFDSQSTKSCAGKSFHGDSSSRRRVSGDGFMVQHISFQRRYVTGDGVLSCWMVFLLTLVSVHVSLHDFILSTQAFGFHGS